MVAVDVITRGVIRARVEGDLNAGDPLISDSLGFRKWQQENRGPIGFALEKIESGQLGLISFNGRYANVSLDRTMSSEVETKLVEDMEFDRTIVQRKEEVLATPEMLSQCGIACLHFSKYDTAGFVRESKTWLYLKKPGCFLQVVDAMITYELRHHKVTIVKGCIPKFEDLHVPGFAKKDELAEIVSNIINRLSSVTQELDRSIYTPPVPSNIDKDDAAAGEELKKAYSGTGARYQGRKS